LRSDINPEGTPRKVRELSKIRKSRLKKSHVAMNMWKTPEPGCTVETKKIADPN